MIGLEEKVRKAESKVRSIVILQTVTEDTNHAEEKKVRKERNILLVDQHLLLAKPTSLPKEKLGERKRQKERNNETNKRRFKKNY